MTGEQPFSMVFNYQIDIDVQWAAALETETSVLSRITLPTTATTSSSGSSTDRSNGTHVGREGVGGAEELTFGRAAT